MKKILIAILLAISSSTASAHQFWPDDYTVYREPGSTTLVMTHLYTKEDGFFTFTLNGHQLGEQQYVPAGTNTDFPVIVPNRMIKSNEVTVCSLRESTDTLQQEVCLRIGFQ